MYDTTYTQNLLTRLEKLERFVRVMKVSLVLCGLLIGALLMMGQAPGVPTTLRAERIEMRVPGDNSWVDISSKGLVFSGGNVVSGNFYETTYAPHGFSVYGTNGAGDATLRVDDGEPSLSLTGSTPHLSLRG